MEVDNYDDEYADVISALPPYVNEKEVKEARLKFRWDERDIESQATLFGEQ